MSIDPGAAPSQAEPAHRPRSYDRPRAHFIPRGRPRPGGDQGPEALPLHGATGPGPGTAEAGWGMSVRHADRQIDIAGSGPGPGASRVAGPAAASCRAASNTAGGDEQHCEVWRAALAAAVKGKQPASSVVEALAGPSPRQAAVERAGNRGPGAYRSAPPAGLACPEPGPARDMRPPLKMAVTWSPWWNAEELVARMPQLVSAATA